jgi:pimeloyl-ACP methyl ester carboxylesterase
MSRPTCWERKMREILRVTSADGTGIAASVSGQGPALVLLHGTTGSWFSWNFVSPLLESEFTVYVVHRRGRGESGDSKEYALAREAEDVAAVVDGIGSKAYVFGHSYGANCALEGALLTDNIAKLVLYEPGVEFPYPNGLIEKLEELIAQGKDEAALSTAFAHFGLSEEELTRLRSSPTWVDRVALAYTIPRESRADGNYKVDPERLKPVTVPTLLLVGSESEPPSKRGIEQLSTALPNAEVRVLQGHGHAGILTGPELVANEVKRFCLSEP